MRPGDVDRLRTSSPAAADTTTLIAQVALLKAAREYGLTRVITYHQRVAAAHAFADTLPAVADQLPPKSRPRAIYAAAVDGRMSRGARRAILHHLETPHTNLVTVSNAKVLAEGVDVPALDGVMFVDPRNSQIDVTQAVGRALRKGDTVGKVATIIIPIVVKDQESPEAAFERSNWNTLYRVIRALRAHDERMAEWLDKARCRSPHRGSEGGDKSDDSDTETGELPPWLAVTGPQVDQKFAQSLGLRIIENATSDWWAGYAAATAYREAYGDLEVPVGYVTADGYPLGSWLKSQRTRRRGFNSPLADSQTAELDALGIDWHDRRARVRPGMLAAAREFQREHGHLNAPTSFVTRDGLKLGEWLCVQRMQRHTLDPDQAAELEALGIDWTPTDSHWWRYLDRVGEFHQEHGHINIPTHYTTPDGLRVGEWLKSQRCRRANLGPDRAAALEALGIDWTPALTHWWRQFEHVREFQQRHGHLRVPSGHTTADGSRLWPWLNRQRHYWGQAKLATDQVAALTELGVTPHPYLR